MVGGCEGFEGDTGDGREGKGEGWEAAVHLRKRADEGGAEESALCGDVNG